MSEGICMWTSDGGDGWETTCNNMFMINEGETPSGCEWKFCPFCGEGLEESINE